MRFRTSRRRQTTIAAACVALAAASTSGFEHANADPVGVEIAAHRLAKAVLEFEHRKERLPLANDAQHARTIDPVMTQGAAIWIHEALPSPPLTVLGGRVFSYNDMTYNPLDAPVLKIRPIDDDQVIPFLARIMIRPDTAISGGDVVAVSFPAPPIFDPRLAEVTAWVASSPAPVSIDRNLDDARLTVRVPLSPAAVASSQGLENTISVIIEGNLELAAYKPISEKRFSDLESTEIDEATAGLARLEIDRDVDDAGEVDQLQRIAATLMAGQSTPYDRVVAANDWVGRQLRYQESPVTRSPIQALEDRSGDCDEHTTLMAALLRSMGIPARRATGLLYDFNALSAHAWVEVGLPTRNGPVHWFIVDPTLAGTSSTEEEKIGYVQFNDRMLLYPMRPSVSFMGITGRVTTDILLNWREQTVPPFTNPYQASEFMDIVTSSVDREISSGAEGLADTGLLMRRESASIVGSPYIIVDRPPAGRKSSSVQLRLENEERLVLDLVARDGSEIDDEELDSLRTVYRDLSRSFFAGRPAYHNLELVYIRNRHSDQLRTARLRVGRYLVEHQLERILKRLSKANLLTEEESAKITAVADASRGKNLYLLQELARRIPVADSQ